MGERKPGDCIQDCDGDYAYDDQRGRCVILKATEETVGTVTLALLSAQARQLAADLLHFADLVDKDA